MDVELSDTLNKSWKENKSNFGYRMLAKMGWSEDKGLGKNETGIKNNIKINKRDVNVGLGMEEDNQLNNANKAWNETSSSYNQILDLLKDTYQSSSSSTKKKKKRSQAPVPIISVGMKYKKIKEAKDISSKSAEDKRAIFGASASTSSAAVAATTAADDSIQSSSIVVDVFQSIKYNISTTAEWVDNNVMNDKDETDRASIKTKKKKSKKSKRERHE